MYPDLYMRTPSPRIPSVSPWVDIFFQSHQHQGRFLRNRRLQRIQADRKEVLWLVPEAVKLEELKIIRIYENHKEDGQIQAALHNLMPPQRFNFNYFTVSYLGGMITLTFIFGYWVLGTYYIQKCVDNMWLLYIMSGLVAVLLEMSNVGWFSPTELYEQLVFGVWWLGISWHPLKNSGKFSPLTLKAY